MNVSCECGAPIWSDESTLKKRRILYWQLSNPNLMLEERSQYQFKVNYWTGILNGIIIGPFVLPGNLSTHSYLNFLQSDLPNLMEEVPEEVRESHKVAALHIKVQTSVLL